MWPPTVAVDATCGATMPSGMPVPSASRRLPYWFSMPYATNEPTVAPAPGTMPQMMPINELRPIVGRRFQTSLQRGSRVFTFSPDAIVGDAKPISMRDSTSPRPYAPTITVRYSMPSLRIGTWNVKRSMPYVSSTPTVASMSPMQRLISAFASDAPPSATTPDSPNSTTAKYSGESKRSAKRANGTASTTADTHVMRPPQNAASNVHPSACAGCPCRAIG